jgi:hypothetical protein
VLTFEAHFQIFTLISSTIVANINHQHKTPMISLNSYRPNHTSPAITVPTTKLPKLELCMLKPLDGASPGALVSFALGDLVLALGALVDPPLGDLVDLPLGDLVLLGALDDFPPFKILLC